MLVLLTISLIITDVVKAQSYSVDNTSLVPTNVLDTFKNSFDIPSFNYFPYECIYDHDTRICYLAYNSQNEYVKIEYQGSGYSYDYIISKGIDDNLTITGDVLTYIDYEYIVLVAMCFGVLTLFVYKLIVRW